MKALNLNFFNLLNYLWRIPVSLGAAALVWVFSIPLALTCGKNGNLPGKLYYLQTFDATLDEGWLNPQYGYDPKAPVWWNRSKWLRRNPGYGVDYWLLGIDMIPRDWVIVQAEQGWFKAYDHSGHFNTEYGGPNWPGELKLGWKAKNYRTDDPYIGWKPDYQWGPDMRTSFCFTWVPWRRS